MKRIFLGPKLHWLILIVLIAAGWATGSGRLHVIDFNPFIIALLLLTVGVLLLVLKTSKLGQQVTRDPVEEDEV